MRLRFIGSFLKRFPLTRLSLLLLVAGTVSSAHASYIEVGASANYRSSGYDEDNLIESISYTGSFSYYFWEMCAWEVNYTTGYARTVTKGPNSVDPKETIEDNIELLSLDLVLSFAARQDPFRPYIKGGVGYLKKERFRQINDGDIERISTQEGMVPSAGLGFAISLTKELSMKLGVDAWTSPVFRNRKDPVVIDYAGRIGISWMF